MVMSLSLIGYCQCTLTCHPAKFGSGDPLKTEDITRQQVLTIHEYRNSGIMSMKCYTYLWLFFIEKRPEGLSQFQYLCVHKVAQIKRASFCLTGSKFQPPDASTKLRTLLFWIVFSFLKLIFLEMHEIDLQQLLAVHNLLYLLWFIQLEQSFIRDLFHDVFNPLS